MVEQSRKHSEKMMGIQSYRDLKVWQTGMDLAEKCYLVTRNFPKEETYGMISQIRRAILRRMLQLRFLPILPKVMVEKPEKSTYSFST
jgi:hypothetical protein